MEIILREDIKGLGYKNDLVTVRPGYANNFLVPRGLAVVATDSNRRQLAENLRQVSHKAEKLRLDAQRLADGIGTLTLEMPTKAGQDGRIFGKITALQVADALRQLGHEVDRRRIDFPQEIKTLGTYPVTLNLHREVTHQIEVAVVEEA